MSKPKTIYVTQPYLPPLADFLPYLEEIWANKTLTNGGPFHQQLEAALCEHLGVKHVSLFSNGTLALITALQSLRVTGEVLTTPYSFVATAHSLLWHGNKPVFVDVEANTLNMDPSRIEAAITPQTTAIMPVQTVHAPRCTRSGRPSPTATTCASSTTPRTPSACSAIAAACSTTATCRC